MAQIVELATFTDERGCLTIAQDEIPFEIKRVFFIYHAGTQERGGHRHRKNRQALVCVKGNCQIKVNDGKKVKTFSLDRPDKVLILEPQDWHTMYDFSPDAVLLVMASEKYDPSDYIYEGYS